MLTFRHKSTISMTRCLKLTRRDCFLHFKLNRNPNILNCTIPHSHSIALVCGLGFYSIQHHIIGAQMFLRPLSSRLSWAFGFRRFRVDLTSTRRVERPIRVFSSSRRSGTRWARARCTTCKNHYGLLDLKGTLIYP